MIIEICIFFGLNFTFLFIPEIVFFALASCSFLRAGLIIF